MKKKYMRLMVLLLSLVTVVPVLKAQAELPAGKANEILKIRMPLISDKNDTILATMFFTLIPGRKPYLQVGDGINPALDSSESGTLSIPNEIEFNGRTFPVLQVNDSAFAHCPNLEGIVLGSGITQLGAAVFKDCANLKTVNIQGNVSSLSSDMFQQCPSLKQLRISACTSLTSLPREFLSDCSALNFVYLPDSLQRIEPLVFKNCQSLSQIIMPSTLQELGDSAFYQCKKLQTIILPAALTELGDSVFSGCSMLRYIDMRGATQLQLPDSLRSEGPLSGLSHMTIIYTPQGASGFVGTNVINTDSAGVMSCDQFMIGSEELTQEQCLSGEATYRLNKYFGTTMFRQHLGEHNYPIPSNAYIYRVFQVSFSYQDSVRMRCYVNTGQSISLPSNEDLGIDYSHLQFTYLYSGKTRIFTSQVAINQDLTVTVNLKRSLYDVNGDGTIDLQDLTPLVNYLLDMPSPYFFEQNADVNGDGNVDLLDMTALINRLLYGDNQHLLEGGLNILSIGNSYSCDAFSYVPYILQQTMHEAEVHFGILHQGAAGLINHYNTHMVNKVPYERYYTFDENGRWHASDENVVTIDSVLNSREWDIIILQQYSYFSRDYSYYQPYLDNMVDTLRNKLPNVHIAWLLTPAYAEGYFAAETSDTMFYKITNCVQTLMEAECVDFMIPAGTAIQNARHTVLDSLGNYGHLSYEGVHLQDGLPCLIEALTVSQVLADYLGTDAPVDDVDLDVTSNWAQNVVSIPQYNGPVVGMTPENVSLGKRCMKAAIENPYEITFIEE